MLAYLYFVILLDLQPPVEVSAIAFFLALIIGTFFILITPIPPFLRLAGAIFYFPVMGYCLYWFLFGVGMWLTDTWL
jgi:hypothetical protein